MQDDYPAVAVFTIFSAILGVADSHAAMMSVQTATTDTQE